MNEVKQVKVDNWGVYFLQRLKHFFNRTDYCDLTLQFQDNAQLKVHRLVLSACTEYFEILERTCEMYEDCLVMPDDLQADVVVPIVNFMYTGQLEFRMDLLERLYLTSQIMNLPVLTKLLESHRQTTPKPTNCYTAKRKANDLGHHSTPSTSHKRSYGKAFDSNHSSREKKVYQSNKTKEEVYGTPSSLPLDPKNLTKKCVLGEPRPTRYELPEELDTDNVFDNSFCNISYTSKPLMVHPETVKRYSSRRSALFGEPSSSKRYIEGTTTMDIVECKKITNDNIFEDTIPDHKSIDDSEMFPSYTNVKSQPKDPNQLFDQILDQNDTPKITIDTKNSKISADNLDHAKIISEVLKKYSHLLKGNKNIKLKILNSSNSKTKKQKSQQPILVEEKPMQLVNEEQDLTFETDVLDSQQAAKLIAMGAENIKGPWICLICGTPGRALHFTTYYKFRRHLVEVHNEKPVVTICEYCGHKAFKRNYLLHHLFSKHGIAPPPRYHFPKCNQCNYIALNEGFLLKHKMTHNMDSAFRCNVCASMFSTSHQLLQHIQSTGHKYSADRKNNLQCIYCMKVFLRENNLFAHLKTHHKKEAKSDGIIEDSDEEKPRLSNDGKIELKLEPVPNNDNMYEVDVQYQVQSDGNIHVITNKKPKATTPKAKQTILNPEFGTAKQAHKTKTIQNPQPQHVHNEFLQEINVSSASNDEEVVTIDNNEYILKDNQFFPRKMKSQANEEFIISDMIDSDAEHNIHSVTPTTSVDFRSTHSGSFVDDLQQSSVIINKSTNINQPIRFVVSNEEEYKALMAANHPIIFDNGEANKTLTVLTAPHTTTLDTATIDLDNTQSNDMMILQEDFPLNVSEAVASDNSNIVVVYSHPVDSQSKQFQLITTQGLEAQFVQSSAIITQNFETVTTSAPIVNAQVVNSQEVWPNEVHPTLGNQDVQTAQNHQIEIIPQPEETELIPLTDTNETEITTQANVSETSLSDLPEVQSLTDSTTEVTQSQTNEILENNEHNTITQVSITVETTNEPFGQEISDDVSNLQPPVDTTIESNVSCNKEVVEKDITSDNIDAIENVSEGVSVIKEPISNEIPQIVPDIVEKGPDVMLETSQSSEIQVNNQEEIIPDAEQILSPTYTQDESLEINAEPSEQSEIVGAICNDTEVTPIETNEKIKDLTSEWSEDEYDIPEPNVENENVTNELPQTNSVIADSHNEIEESIENIQQEVDKQMSMAVENKIESQTNGNSSPSSVITIANEAKESVVSTNPDISQEKISSLLNDWEDNDSQGGLSSDKIENTQTDTTVDEKIEIPEQNEVINSDNQNIIKPGDNIKSLVSDWDDDEEEIKN